MTRMFFALSLGFVGVILATQIGFSAPQIDNRKPPITFVTNPCQEARQARAGTDRPPTGWHRLQARNPAAKQS
jgi:hypothetical protein